MILAGIASNGFIFAQKIAQELAQISDLKVTLCEVKINKLDPKAPITTSIARELYENKGDI